VECQWRCLEGWICYNSHSQYDRLQELPVMNTSTRARGTPLGCFPGQPTPRLYGRVVDEIGTPRCDGSALYTVPFKLSRRPRSQWAQLFVRAWNHPSRFTTMHRPGIASVQGDRVVLDGTTVEEIDRYHRETLILAGKEANQGFQEPGCA